MAFPHDSKADDDRSPVARLLDCHVRIRQMLELARTLATEPRGSDDELSDSCGRIMRYFKRALPMHVRDEEESILPRLEHGPARDALGRMRHEHQGHDEKIAALVQACAALRDEPARWEERRHDIASSTAAVAEVMLPHLNDEERDIFPSISSLDDATQALIAAEMQTRRDADGGGGGGGGGGRGRDGGGRRGNDREGR